MGPDPLAQAVAGVVGREHVLTDAGARAPYETDWTGRFFGPCRFVVRPAGTDEVAEVLRRCAAARQAVVPQGGNTGLVGGGVPRGGEVVVSLRRLDAMEPVEPVSGTVVAQAGVALAALQDHAEAAGFEAGMDFASRDSATLGGMVATNAGGMQVLRHGDVRARVRGLEAVRADGTVVTRLTRLAKDSSGYALPGLLVGSEGTLAVVTRVVWQLVPAAPRRVLALVGTGGFAEALALLAHVRARVPGLRAAETFGDDELALVRAHHGLGPPLSAPAARYLLLEAAGVADASAELAAALDHPLAGEVAVGLDRPGRARLWSYREGITTAISAEGVPVKFDVAVPLDTLADVAGRLPAVVTEACPGARVLLFGHLAEGNLHVNVLGADLRDHRQLTALDAAVLGLVAAAGGAISAEHGIGQAKTRWLSLTRSPADIAAMQSVKHALDPAGLLNPGVLLPAALTGPHPT